METKTLNNYITLQNDGKVKLMKRISFWLLFVLAATIFVSCTKDNTTETQSATLTVSATELTFGDIANGAISNEQSFSLSGVNLTSSVIIKAPGGFQVSKTNVNNFYDSLEFSYTNGSLANTTIYVRFKPSSVQTYNANIEVKSSGISKNICVTGNGIQTSFIHPLTTGNTWTYIDSIFYQDHNLQGLDTSRVGIIGKDSIDFNGQFLEVYYRNSIDMSSNQPTGASWLLRNELYGLYSYGYKENSTGIIHRSMAFKYPVSVGDNWKTYAYSSTPSSWNVVDSVTTTCVAVNEVFKTPAGNFDCFVYKFSYFGFDFYTYYSKGIGEVGSVLKYYNSNTILQKKCLIANSTTKFSLRNAKKHINPQYNENDLYIYGFKGIKNLYFR